MRVLLDENLPHDLTGALIGHSVSTVQALGWAGTKNGALLKRASGLIDALVTMDRNLEHQQDINPCKCKVATFRQSPYRYPPSLSVIVS